MPLPRSIVVFRQLPAQTKRLPIGQSGGAGDRAVGHEDARLARTDAGYLSTVPENPQRSRAVKSAATVRYAEPDHSASTDRRRDLDRRELVPVRTILTTIGLVFAAALTLLIIYETRRVLVWVVIAAFFAVALYPVVSWVQERVSWCRRWLATLLVFLLVVLVLGSLVAVFAVPLAREGTTFAGQLPALLADARAGRGPVGELLTRINAEQYVDQYQDRIGEFASGLGTAALSFARSIATGVAAAVTIFILAYLLVLEGPKITGGTLALFPPARAHRIRHVAADCAKTITATCPAICSSALSAAR